RRYPPMLHALFRPLLFLCLGLILLFLAAMTVQAAPWHKPPQAQTSGYGSAQRHIATSFTQFRLGSAQVGDQTWYYLPDQLKYGDRAPVVIFLHGFAALVPG